MLGPFIDPKLGNFAKGEWTQLQFIFEAVTPSTSFPLGVRTHYRSYSSDTTYEIEPDSGSTVGFSETHVTVSTQPTGGMYILQKVPQSDIFPAPFQPGGRAEFDKVLT
jgi:hypothetical protein